VFALKDAAMFEERDIIRANNLAPQAGPMGDSVLRTGRSITNSGRSHPA